MQNISFKNVICWQMKKVRNDRKYYQEWKEYVDNIKIPEFPWSHAYAIKEVVEKIPSNSVLHLSINDSIRITNF